MSNNVGDHLVSAQQATHAKLRAMIFSVNFKPVSRCVRKKLPGNWA